MKKKISIILVILILLTGITSGASGMEDRLRAYLIADYRTGEILEGFNIDEVVEIASITKIMTYLVTMDQVETGRISLDDLVEMDEESLMVGGSSLKLEAGKTFTVSELLDMALVVSANNATHRLARYVGKTEGNFVMMMNAKAREIGLESAMFYNSTGLPVKGIEAQNHMKVRDILKLSRYIISGYPEVLTRTSKPFLADVDGRIVENTNPLLGKIEGIDGFKTGFTNKAGHSYVSTLMKKGEEAGEHDLRLIGIIMGTKGEKAREEVSYFYMQQAVDKYKDLSLLDLDIPLKRIYSDKVKKGEFDIYPREEFRKIIDENNLTDIEINLKEKIRYPIKPDKSIGKVSVWENGSQLFETDIIVKEKVKKANIIVRLFRFLKSLAGGI